MVKHHLIISGTGRAGTTFLVQLMTELGMETGFADSMSNVFSNCHAGMEHDLRDKDAPYIVKSPFICDYLEEVVQSGQVVIDRAIVPVRDLYSAAQSRRDVVKRSDPNALPDHIAGGLWDTRNPEQQEAVLMQKLYKLIYVISRHEIPLTLLEFPRLVNEPEYLYRNLTPALSSIGYDSFLKAFQAIYRPELVHNFTNMQSQLRPLLAKPA
jgi:hypothetical protein